MPLPFPLPLPLPMPNTMSIMKGKIASHHGDKVECSHHHHRSSSDDDIVRSDNKLIQIGETALNEITNLTNMKKGKILNTVQSLKQSLKNMNGDAAASEVGEKEDVETTTGKSAPPKEFTIGFDKEFEIHIG